MALFEPTGRDWVRVTGADRVSFLHGMLTCDVKRLAAGAVCPAALLSAKGGLVAIARVWRFESEFWVETGPGQGARVREHLGRFLVSEDAELADAGGELTAVSLLGPKAAELLGASVATDVAATPGRWTLLASEWGPLHLTSPWLSGRAGLDLAVDRARWPSLLARLEAVGRPFGLLRGSAGAYEVLRVESGVPLHGVDVGETSLVQEAGLERAVSFDKGCYLGQEVVARSTFRGQVQKGLTGLLLGEAQPAAGAALLAQGKPVGRITSVVRSPALGQTVALATVHRDFLTAGTRLDLEGRPGAATVHALPFA